MKRLLAVMLFLFLVACAPTTDLYMQAQQAEWEAERAQREAQALQNAMTATAGAPMLQITEQAALLELERQRAEMTSTAYWSTIEAAYTPTPNATSTYVMAVLNSQQTAMVAESERNLLELERQRNANMFKAVMPGLTFAFLGVAVILFFMMVVRRERVRVIPRDPRGDAPLLLDTIDGVSTDMDANPNYQTTTRPWKNGVNPMPQLPAITAERQDKTKNNDQMIDLATRGMPGQGNRTEDRKQIATEQTMLPLPLGAPRFRLLGPNEKPPDDVIDDATIEVLNTQWEEVDDE